MNSREWLRKERIEEISAYLIQEQNKGEKIDKQELIIALTAKYNISRKTAVDYVNVVWFKNGFA